MTETHNYVCLKLTSVWSQLATTPSNRSYSICVCNVSVHCKSVRHLELSKFEIFSVQPSLWSDFVWFAEIVTKHYGVIINSQKIYFPIWRTSGIVRFLNYGFWIWWYELQSCSLCQLQNRTFHQNRIILHWNMALATIFKMTIVRQFEFFKV